MSSFFSGWLQDFLFGFQQFDYYIHLGVYVGACVRVCVFSLLGILWAWASGTCGLVSVTNFGKFLAIILSAPFFFFSPLGIPVTWMFGHFILSYMSWMLYLVFTPPGIFNFVFSLSNFCWLIFMLMDSFLYCVQSTDKPIIGILHLSLFFISQSFSRGSLFQFLSP